MPFQFTTLKRETMADAGKTFEELIEEKNRKWIRNMFTKARIKLLNLLFCPSAENYDELEKNGGKRSFEVRGFDACKNGLWSGSWRDSSIAAHKNGAMKFNTLK